MQARGKETREKKRLGRGEGGWGWRGGVEVASMAVGGDKRQKGAGPS